MTGWTLIGEPAARTAGVTSIEGVFFRDTRILSKWRLLINDIAPEPLSVLSGEPYTATFVTQTRPSPALADTTLVLERPRFVGAGMREDLKLRNFGREAAE